MSKSSPRARPPIHRRGPVFRALKAVAVGLTVALLALIAGGIWAFRTGRAAPWIREAMVEQLRSRCGVETELGSFAVDPLALRLRIGALRLRQQATGVELLAVDQAEVAVRGLPLLYGRVQLKWVQLDGPAATLRIVDGGLADVPRCLIADEVPSRPSKPIAFGVDTLQLRRGRLQLRWAALRAEATDIELSAHTAPGGGVQVKAGVGGVQVHRPGLDNHLERLSLRGHVEGRLSDPRAFVVDELSAAGEGVEVKLTGVADRLGPVFSADVQLRGPAETLPKILPAVPAMRGRVKAKASVSGRLTELRAVGQLDLRKVWVDEFYLGDDTQLRFAADRSGMDIHRLRVRLGDGAARVQGRLDFDSKLSLRVGAELRRFSLGRLLSALTVEHSWADLKITGKTQIRGALRPFSLSGPFDLGVADLIVTDGGFDLPRFAGRLPPRLPPEDLFLYIPKLQLRGRWSFDGDGISFHESTILTGSTEAKLDARVGFSMERGLRLKGSFPRLDLRDLGPVGGLKLAGSGPVTLSMRGAYDTLTADGRLSLRGIEVGDIPWGDATGVMRWRDLVRLELAEVRGLLGRSRYQAEIGVRFEGEVPISVRGAVLQGRLQDMFIPLRLRAADWGEARGALEANFELQGPVDHLEGPYRAKLGRVWGFGEEAQSGEIYGRMADGVLLVESLELNKGGGRLIGAGALDFNADTIWVRASSQRLRLADIDLIRVTQPKLDGGVKVKLDVRGSLSEGVNGSLSLDLQRLKAGPVALGSGRLAGPVDGRKLSFEGGLPRVGLRLDGWLRLGDDIAYASKLWMEDTDLPAILLGLQGEQGWNGAVNLSGDLHGRLVAWERSSGSIQLRSARADSELLSLRTTAPAQLGLQNGVFEMRKLGFTGPLLKAELSGRAGTELLDLKAQGSVDLALAERLMPPVEKAEGRLRFQGAIGGRPSAMNLLGVGRLETRVMKWSGFEDRVTAFLGELEFSQSSVWIRSGEGRWAGGRLKLGGRVELEHLLPASLDLRVGLTRSRPRFHTPLADLTGEVSGKLGIQGPLERLEVRGEVDVRRGLIRPRTDFQSLIGAASTVEVYDPDQEVVDMDIRLRLLNNVRVQNADVDLEMGGELRLTGSNERFGMLGNLALLQGGQVLFFAREYIVQSGAIRFRDRYRMDPSFDLVLSAEACEARIRVGLSGDLEHVQTQYSSTPQLDQRDVVSCLIQGVKVTQVGDQGLSSLAGSALLKLSGVDQQVRRVLLIDQIDVTSEYSSAERAYEPRVVVAKNLSLLGRSSRLEYSTSLLRTTDQRAAFRVRLLPRLTLQLGWTSSEDVPYGDWGLDLKHRWQW